jgi:hypothetical protein
MYLVESEVPGYVAPTTTRLVPGVPVVPTWYKYRWRRLPTGVFLTTQEPHLSSL